jgi:predicted transcriptional regulator of viral defense system
VFDAEPLRVSTAVTVPTPGEVAVQPALDPVHTTMAVLDPTQVYTPEQVEARILDCVARLEFGGAYERNVIGKAYGAKQAYEMAAAKAHVKRIGEGSEKDRLALALTDTEDLFNAMTEAEMVRKAVAATMHNLRSILNGYQSVLKSINGSLPYGGSPGGGR